MKLKVYLILLLLFSCAPNTKEYHTSRDEVILFNKLKEAHMESIKKRDRRIKQLEAQIDSLINVIRAIRGDND